MKHEETGHSHLRDAELDLASEDEDTARQYQVNGPWLKKQWSSDQRHGRRFRDNEGWDDDRVAERRFARRSDWKPGRTRRRFRCGAGDPYQFEF